MINPISRKTYSLKSVIIAVATAQFIMPYMLAGVGPLLPVIGMHFNATAVELSLINAIYALSLTIFHLIAGRISDILGLRRVFLIGLGLFTCTSGVLPFSPNITFFFILRFIQAIGAALMNTSGLSILTNCSPKDRLGQTLGIASIGIYLGLSLSPCLAGIMAKFFGWSYLFYLMIPIGLIAWLLMKYTVKEEWYIDAEYPFDWTGSILYAISISTLSIGMIWVLNGIWPIVFLSIGIIFFGSFFKVELTKDHPILDIKFLIHNHAFLYSIFALLINYSSIFGLAFYFSLYLQLGYGLSVLTTGLILSLQPFVQVIISPIAGRLADAFGAIKIAIVGMIMCGVGLFLAIILEIHSNIFEIAYIQMILGLGAGLFASPNMTAIMSAVDSKHMSQAAGLIGTMRTFGLLLSMLIISITMNIYFSGEILTAKSMDKFIAAMDMNFWIFSLLNMIAIIFSIMTLKVKRKVSI